MIYSTDMNGLALNFVHRRIGAGIRSFVTSGFSPTAAAIGFVQGGGRRETGRRPRMPSLRAARREEISIDSAPMRSLIVRRPPPRSSTARPDAFSSAEKAAGRRAKFSVTRGFGVEVSGPCPPLMKPDPVTGECKFFIGDRPGRDIEPLVTGPGVSVGDAVMGRYGAAYMPGSKIVDRAVCLPGDVVGDDGLCYPRSSLRNNQRAWPKGRRPLLTGGDMRAISVAARAGRRLEGAAKRLQKIGLMKKPAPRRAPKMITTDHHHHT